MFRKMAGWLSDSETDDDEVLNLSLFLRKSFGFKGFPEEKENTLKKIVTHLGASCDDYPKYVFTNKEYFSSLTENNNHLYNVTYIRDCVDANRCLSIDQYRFGPKQAEKKEYRDFEPCCANFHNDKGACTICDPLFASEVPGIKKRKKVIEQSSDDSPIEDIHSENTPKQIVYWEHWESQMLLDYVVQHNLFKFVRGKNLYKRIHADGMLLHRTVESMKTHFRHKIFNNLRSYNLSESSIRKLRKVKNDPNSYCALKPGMKIQAVRRKVLSKNQNGQLKKKKVLNNKQNGQLKKKVSSNNQKSNNQQKRKKSS